MCGTGEPTNVWAVSCLYRPPLCGGRGAPSWVLLNHVCNKPVPTSDCGQEHRQGSDAHRAILHSSPHASYILKEERHPAPVRLCGAWSEGALIMDALASA